MILEVMIGTLAVGHAIKEIAKDRRVINKLQEWSDKCKQKVEELEKQNN